MGLDDKATQFLLASRQLGVSFEQTATIGRQRLYITKSGLAKRLSAFGITLGFGFPVDAFRPTFGGTRCQISTGVWG